MEVVKVESGIAVFLSEYSGDVNSFEFIGEEGPLVAESDHGFDTFLTLHFERCGGCGLRGEVRCWCTARTDYRLQFLRWE